MAKKWLRLEKRLRALENAIAKLVVGKKSATKKTKRKMTAKKRVKTPKRTKGKSNGKKASKAPAPGPTKKTRRKIKKTLADPMTIVSEETAGTPVLFAQRPRATKNASDVRPKGPA